MERVNYVLIIWDDIREIEHEMYMWIADHGPEHPELTVDLYYDEYSPIRCMHSTYSMGLPMFLHLVNGMSIPKHNKSLKPIVKGYWTITEQDTSLIPEPAGTRLMVYTTKQEVGSTMHLVADTGNTYIMSESGKITVNTQPEQPFKEVRLNPEYDLQHYIMGVTPQSSGDA